ncbi:MAG: ATP-binding cassette domain-containing protein [Candidatus Brocadiaceae bacterium]|nr:ATP-binding cassette domain-containing protein [Candidatus Brocadiaceae bacterium]
MRSTEKKTKSSKTAIEVINISRDYGTGRGLFNVSINVQWNEVVSVIGTNGAGKTTLLRCISLFETIDSGFIRLDNENWANADNKPVNDFFSGSIMGSFLGIVFQNYALWPHFNVWQNVSLPLKIAQGLELDKISEMTEGILKEFEIFDYKTSMPHELSGGLKQRTMLARTLALQPKVLLLDEVTSGLDPEWTERVRCMIREFAKNGGAVLNVGHQLGFVQRLSDRVIFLNSGQVECAGAPCDMLINPKSDKLKIFIENA